MNAPQRIAVRTRTGLLRVQTRGRNPWHHDGRDGRHTRRHAVWEHQRSRSSRAVEWMCNAAIVGFTLLIAGLCVTKGWNW